MRKSPLLALPAAAIAILVAVWLLFFRAPATPADLAAYLPNKEGTLLYVNVDAMRKSGILNMLAGSKAAEDLEYKEFLDQTGFDYRHDLDAIAGTFRSGQAFFALRGRFNWPKLAAYAKKHSGSCRDNYCVADGSKPGRRISFHKLRSNVMALAVSSDEMAAYQINRNASKVNPFTPEAPIWIMVPAPVLKEANGLPSGAQAFALVLRKADRAIFSINPEGDHLKITASVTCQNIESASSLLVQLESTTNLLRSMLARERKEASPRDLSGVLVAGSFRREDRQVYGEWPLQRVFVESIAGASY